MASEKDTFIGYYGRVSSESSPDLSVHGGSYSASSTTDVEQDPSLENDGDFKRPPRRNKVMGSDRKRKDFLGRLLTAVGCMASVLSLIMLAVIAHDVRKLRGDSEMTEVIW